MAGEWKQGLCGCFSNTSVCCFSMILAPLTIGKIAEKFGEKQPVLWAMSGVPCPCVMWGLMRTKIREKDGIDGSFTGDCCTNLFCMPCAQVQLAAHTEAIDYLLPKDQNMQRVEPQQQ